MYLKLGSNAVGPRNPGEEALCPAELIPLFPAFEGEFFFPSLVVIVFDFAFGFVLRLLHWLPGKKAEAHRHLLQL